MKEYNFLFIFYIRTFVGYLVPQNVEHSTMIFFQFLLFAVKRKMKEERRRKIIFFPHCNHLLYYVVHNECACVMQEPFLG